MKDLFENNKKCLGVPLKFLFIMFLLLYVISPVDLLPEAVLGPLGLPDDIIALLTALKLSGIGDNTWKTLKGVTQ